MWWISCTAKQSPIPIAGWRTVTLPRLWTEQQNAVTEAYLAAVPGRDRIRRRLEELLAIGVLSAPTPKRGRYFYLRREGRQNQPVLYWRDGVEGADRVAVDPNALNEAGTTALDWYYPSEDGRLLAYGLSENGNEESVLHLLELDTGRQLPDRIPRMRAASLPGSPTGEASTTPATPHRDRCLRVRSRTTVPSTSIGSAPTRRPIPWSSSLRRRSIGPVWASHPMGAGSSSAWRGPSIRSTSIFRTSNPGESWFRLPATCRRRSKARSPTAVSSCGPTSMRRPTGCMRWIPSIPTAAPGARSFHREPTPYWRALQWRATGWPSAISSGHPRVSGLPILKAGSSRMSRSRRWVVSSGSAPSGTAASCSTASHPTPCLRASTASTWTPVTPRSGGRWRQRSTPADSRSGR